MSAKNDKEPRDEVRYDAGGERLVLTTDENGEPLRVHMNPSRPDPNEPDFWYPLDEAVREVRLEKVELSPSRARVERRAGFLRVCVFTHAHGVYYSHQFKLTPEGKRSAQQLAQHVFSAGTINRGEAVWRTNGLDDVASDSQVTIFPFRPLVRAE